MSGSAAGSGTPGDAAAPFVVSLRTRPEGISLVPEGATEVIALRVQVAEAWDAVRVEAAPSTPVRAVTRAALAVLLPDAGDVEGGYVTKLRGAEVRDDGVSLRDAGVVAGSTLLVMARRRSPVR